MYATASDTNQTGNGVYERVKARVIAHDLPVGKRISIEPLADQLFVSSTPVREALIRLSAEHVIQGVPKSGFFIKEISETEIRDLYALQHLLLNWALSNIRDNGFTPGILKPPNLSAEMGKKGDMPSHIAVNLANTLFLHIARQSGNTDVIRIINNINDRTHYICDRDFTTFTDLTHATLQLCDTYYKKEFDSLHEGLRVYFHQKAERLPKLLKVLRGDFIKGSG